MGKRLRGERKRCRRDASRTAPIGARRVSGGAERAGFPLAVRLGAYLTSKSFARDLVFLLAVLCFRSSVLATYWVPSGSMRPTILEGERFVANKLAYRLKVPFTRRTLVAWSAPRRGDVIVFRGQGGLKDDMTKRVVGLPGDTIRLVRKALYVNGRPVPVRRLDDAGEDGLFEENLDGVRHRIRHRSAPTFLDDAATVRVPEDSLFVMGDNRDESADSRVWGFVPLEAVEGRIILRYYAADPGRWLPRWDRLGWL